MFKLDGEVLWMHAAALPDDATQLALCLLWLTEPNLTKEL